MTKNIGQVTVPISDIINNVTMTIKVTGAGRFNFRMKMAVYIIRFASWVCPIKTVVSTDLMQ